MSNSEMPKNSFHQNNAMLRYDEMVEKNEIKKIDTIERQNFAYEIDDAWQKVKASFEKEGRVPTENAEAEFKRILNKFWENRH